MTRRVGQLGLFVLGCICVLICVEFVQGDPEPGTPGPAAEQLRANQVAPTEPAGSSMLDRGNNSLASGASEETGVNSSPELILNYATFVIAVLALLFAAFLAWFGYREQTSFKKIHDEMAEQRRAVDERIERFKGDLEEQRKKFAEDRRAVEEKIESLDTRVGMFNGSLEVHEKRIRANGRFLDAVLEHHSDLLLGVLEGFRPALAPEEDQRLRSLISEAEAALDLFRPDPADVPKSLWRLEEIGADAAVPFLVRLIKDREADPEMRIEAQRVLDKIRVRLKEARKDR